MKIFFTLDGRLALPSWQSDFPSFVSCDVAEKCFLSSWAEMLALQSMERTSARFLAQIVVSRYKYLDSPEWRNGRSVSRYFYIINDVSAPKSS